MKSKFGDHTVDRRSHSLHDVYAIMLGGLPGWIKNKYNMFLQVLLTIEQQALNVTSTKVTQPNTLKSCMP